MDRRLDRDGAEVSLAKRRRWRINPLLTPGLIWLAPLAFLALFYFYPLFSILQVSFAARRVRLDGCAAGNPHLPFHLPGAELHHLAGGALHPAHPGDWAAGGLSLRPLPVSRQELYFRPSPPSPLSCPRWWWLPLSIPCLGRRGWLNLALMQLFSLTEPPLELTNSLAAILLAHVFYNTTIVLRMVGDFWSHLDPRLGQAAQVSAQAVGGRSGRSLCRCCYRRSPQQRCWSSSLTSPPLGSSCCWAGRISPPWRWKFTPRRSACSTCRWRPRWQSSSLPARSARRLLIPAYRTACSRPHSPAPQDLYPGTGDHLAGRLAGGHPRLIC